MWSNSCFHTAAADKKEQYGDHAVGQVCCSPGDLFANAKMLRCIFHLFIDAWDRKFGFGMMGPWFQEYKSYLFRLKVANHMRNLKKCTDFVLRKAAGSQHGTFPNISVLKFIMA